MDFNYESPNWNAAGELDENLKSTGFTAGYKPPASIFNWFWTRVSNCITELQSKLASVDEAKAAKNHQSSGSDYGMGTSNYYGHVKLSDSVSDSTHTASGGVAASPYAVKLAYDAAEAKAGTDVATSSADGLMSAEDKTRLDTINQAILNVGYLDGIGITSSSEGVMLFFSDLDDTYMWKNKYYNYDSTGTAVQIGVWGNSLPIYRKCGTATIPSSGFENTSDDTEISGINSDNASVILREDYWCDYSHFGSYIQFRESCANLKGSSVYYVIEYIAK